MAQPTATARLALLYSGKYAVTLLVERGPGAFAAVIGRPFITAGEDRYLD